MLGVRTNAGQILAHPQVIRASGYANHLAKVIHTLTGVVVVHAVSWIIPTVR